MWDDWTSLAECDLGPVTGHVYCDEVVVVVHVSVSVFPLRIT